MAATFDSCDPNYLRYFNDKDVLFVRGVFRTIANYETTNLNKDLTSADISSLLAGIDLNEEFSELSIYFGSHPRSGATHCVAPQQLATTLIHDDSWAAMSVCPHPFQLSIAGGYLRPHKGVRAPDGTPFNGYGCDQLGERESDFLACPGSLLLHELIHWEGPLSRIPDFDTFINIAPGNTQRRIEDLVAPKQTQERFSNRPLDRYWQFNSRRLKELSMFSPTYPPYVILNNVDSCVSYAISKYWSWRCGRRFREVLSQADAWKRMVAPFPPPPTSPALPSKL